jgi:hypothetical protein
MSIRLFSKFGWSYDTDCRLTKMPQRIGVTVAPTLTLVLPPYSLANGGGGHGHHKIKRANRKSFRASYLGKAVRWFTRNRVRHGLTPNSP